jgi:exopolyphosphatase/guanosine-5'-triphosphate,3'-diphosphate pyrophosphatase
MMENQKVLSGELSQRMAAIDIGSNSIRLVVAEALRGGNYRILDEDREATRLGRTLHSTGQLDRQSMNDALAALRRFKQIAESFQPTEIRTIATCAVREASNGPEFCARALAELGLKIEVISAEKEARFAFFSVLRNFDLEEKKIVLADIGGGSTELVLASGSMIEAVFTTDLGAVRLTERFDSGQAMGGDNFEDMIRAIDRKLRKKIGRPYFTPHVLIGSGGTFTTLASMMMAQKNQVGLPACGYFVSRAEVSHLLDRLRKMPPRARAATGGLSADRADIIVAGLAVIDRIMHRFEVNTLQVHNRGVRDGLLLSMIGKAQGHSKDSTASVDRDAVLDRFALSCRSELEHGKHIALLAGQIYRQLADPLGLAPADAPLLEAAARLQDVGYLINYDQHHKHSYHLILNSRLPGFLPEELEIIANVARYHRGGEPKKKHANFRQLNRADRARVKHMVAILRIASGLDRSHSHQVTEVRVQVEDQKIQMLAEAAQHPDVDLWGARRRAELFEKVFHYPLSIDWAGTASTAPSDRKANAEPEMKLHDGEQQTDNGSQSSNVSPLPKKSHESSTQRGHSRDEETSRKAGGK